MNSDKMTPFQKKPMAAPSKETVEKLRREAVAQGLNFDDDVAPRLYEHPGELFVNNYYHVIRERVGSLWHLSIRSLDPERCRSWRELQQIKDELVGRENEGVELFPARTRLADLVDQYHLWVAVDSAYRFPFGFE